MFSIRSARLDDAEDLAALTSELGYVTTPEALLPRLAFLIEDADHEVLVADVDGKAIAWIGLVRAYGLTSDAHAMLSGFVVGAEHRSSGVGARLLDAAENWARQRGCQHLRVHTNVVRARAHAFYERLGYERIKEQRVYEKVLDGA